MTNKYASIIEKLQGHYVNSVEVFPVSNEAHLNKIESDLGHALPEDYKDFLRNYAGIAFKYLGFPYVNGHYPTQAGIDSFEDSRVADHYYLTRENFGSVSSEAGEEPYPGIHLVRDALFPASEMDWPEELLPIAYDAGGNPICLALFGPHPGAIFYWVMGQDIFFVADSFNEFMELLQVI